MTWISFILLLVICAVDLAGIGYSVEIIVLCNKSSTEGIDLFRYQYLDL